MVILSIADLHLTNANELSHDAFENSLTNFESFLRSKIEEDKNWKPDYVCICGDIANKAQKDEFRLAENVVDRIAKSAYLSKAYVMAVPGNHDLIRPDKKQQRSALRAIEHWLQSGDTKGTTKTQKDKNKLALHHTLHSMFNGYAKWRASILPDMQGMRYIDLMAKVGIPPMYGLHGLCGLRIFEKEKVVFAELNSSWCDLGGKNRDVRFGKIIVDIANQELESLKRQGYFVVGLLALYLKV